MTRGKFDLQSVVKDRGETPRKQCEEAKTTWLGKFHQGALPVLSVSPLPPLIFWLTERENDVGEDRIGHSWIILLFALIKDPFCNYAGCFGVGRAWAGSSLLTRDSGNLKGIIKIRTMKLLMYIIEKSL